VSRKPVSPKPVSDQLRMLPREHGAYGQLLFPLVTTLAIGRPSPAAVAIAAVAMCFFLAHEPLLVLLGERGPRAARTERHRARRWMALLGAAAAGFAVVLVAFSTRTVQLALLAPVVLAAAVLTIILAGRERTIGGEVLSALAFASIAVPMALAAGATPTAAIACAAVFAAQFVSATLAVHAVILRTRQPPAIRSRLIAAAVASGSVLGLAWLAARGAIAGSAPLAVLPAWIASCSLAAVPPPARRLRVVGWCLLATSLTTAMILVATLT